MLHVHEYVGELNERDPLIVHLPHIAGNGHLDNADHDTFGKLGLPTELVRGIDLDDQIGRFLDGTLEDLLQIDVQRMIDAEVMGHLERRNLLRLLLTGRKHEGRHQDRYEHTQRSHSTTSFHYVPP